MPRSNQPISPARNLRVTLLWVSLTLLMIALVIRAGYDIKDPDAEVTNRPIRVKADQFVSSPIGDRGF